MTITAASDDRFRGISTSDKHPVATTEISYDDASGLYAGASVTAGPLREGGVSLLRSVQYAGYAHRVRPGLSLDFGVTNRIYGEYATVEYGRRFLQAYVGVVGRKVSTRLFFAPDYDGVGGAAGYLEADALVDEHGPWSLAAHAGVLVPQKSHDGRVVEIDWRLGVTRRLGPLGVSLNWVGSGPHDEKNRWTGTFVLSANRSF